MSTMEKPEEVTRLVFDFFASSILQGFASLAFFLVVRCNGSGDSLGIIMEREF